MNLNYLNPFSSKFLRNDQEERKLQKQIEDNSAGLSDIELDILAQGLGSTAGRLGTDSFELFASSINFSQVFASKKERVMKYREMSYYPEISEALDVVCDEAIVQDDKGEVLHLNLTREIPKKYERLMLKEFNYITEDVIKVKDNLWDIFYKWLVEGELFVELIANKKSNKIIGYKVLPCFTTFPVYNKNGKIEKFGQTAISDSMSGRTTLELIPFERNQLSYTNWGRYGRDLLDVRGYLEATVKTYNQLKNLEDSLIVYRLVRAPERRVWNIEVGRLPNQKVEQHITNLIHKYKRKSNYDPNTGTIDASRNVHSLAEDYWFPKREGVGTSVETIGGGMNLGELEDVRYFLGKMYKTLKLPKTRWDGTLGQQSYSTGKDLDRDELKFTFFIKRIQNRFKKFIIDIYHEHLKFKYGNDPQWKKYLNRNIIDVDFTPSNFFFEMKELEKLNEKLGVLGTAITYASTPVEPHLPFSMEYVLKHMFRMTDEEYNLNKKLLEKEKEENKQTQVDDAERQAEIEDIVGKDEEDKDKEKESSIDANKPKDTNFADQEEQEKEQKESINININDPSERIKEFLKRKTKRGLL